MNVIPFAGAQTAGPSFRTGQQAGHVSYPSLELFDRNVDGVVDARDTIAKNSGASDTATRVAVEKVEKQKGQEVTFFA
jgi:hypothetical protein